ncbi:MAG: nickel pincer cofactor biosynthesis protein LarB [Candidatus Dormibacteraceae bacterium]
MGHSPLDDLVSAVAGLEVVPLDGIADGQARPDLNREGRTGVPEIVYASGKEFDQIQALATTFVERAGRVIISRIDEGNAQRLVERFPAHQIRHLPRARILVIRRPDFELAVGGRAGIITAGTSDLPVATEAQVIAEEMGCAVTLVSDVGVAGLHRLFGPLRAMLEAGVDAIVVVAGMDGALPSVVSGLVDVPVIGLPTSTGYGVGGRGLAALLSMLQTCAPGLTVVNVDNGVGAGVTAALIANRVARARHQT